MSVRRRRRNARKSLAGAGGTLITTSTSYVNRFDASGNFVPKADGFVEVLIVAGGGGGGHGQDRTGGGGAAGGVRNLGAQAVVKNTVYPVVVGLGGNGGVGGVSGSQDGQDSSAFGITSTKGGKGADFNGAGGNGGSGGGATHGNVAGTGIAGQGFAGGGPGYNSGNGAGEFSGSGGGGKKEPGVAGTIITAGRGGDGMPYYMEEILDYYGAGGGGSAANYGSQVAPIAGPGGLGGGGNGAFTNDGLPYNGVAGTAGKGAGGGAGARAGSSGGNGGRGRVLIRYSKKAGAANRDYLLAGTLADARGGPALTGAGAIAAGGYTMAANDGLTMTNGLAALDEYSIMWKGTVSRTLGAGGYGKLLDIKNRTSDTGLYSLDGKIDVITTAAETFSAPNTFLDGTQHTVIFTRKAATKVINLYIDGVLEVSKGDPLDEYIFAPNVVVLFRDELPGAGETLTGLITRVAVWFREITALEVAAQ